MATITTRSGKGSPLTSTEVDENFTNLNSDKLEASSYTAADILSKVTSVDGTGSGLDADMLDGQEGSYYLNTATNFGGDVSGTYDSLVVADDSHDHVIANVDGLQTALDGKQDALVSGTSIKTVNSQSILGSGNIQIDGGVTSFNTRTGAVSLTSTDVTDALTFTPISASDNAATATALQTARSINGTTFDGTADITVTANTTNTLTRGTYLTGSNFNGSAATTWDVDATSDNTASKVVARDASGNFSAGTITADLSGNASTATTLQTARTINGVSFNGSANITLTANTTNSITPGSYLSGSSFNGSVARTWSVDATTAATAGKVVARDSNGYIFATRVYSGAKLLVGTETSDFENVTVSGANESYIKLKNSYSTGFTFATYYGNSSIRDTGKTNQPGINFTGGAVIPAGGTSSYGPADNLLDFGNFGYRWDDIYATNTVIQTSDRNYKQDIEELSEAEKRVAIVAKSLMRKYRWKDAVEKKGDDARIHYGIIAQDLKAAFENEGLDAHRYAMFTWNEWWEGDRVIPAVEAKEAVYETQIDEEGNETQVCVADAVEAHEEVSYPDIFYTEAEAPANAIRKERMGIRYNELLSFIIAALPGSS